MKRLKPSSNFSRCAESNTVVRAQPTGTFIDPERLLTLSAAIRDLDWVKLEAHHSIGSALWFSLPGRKKKKAKHH